MRINGAPNESEELDFMVGKTEEHFQPELPRNRMVREFKDFARVADSGNRAEMEREMEVTLAVIQTMEMARESSGIIYGD